MGRLDNFTESERASPQDVQFVADEVFNQSILNSVTCISHIFIYFLSASSPRWT